MYSQLKGKHHIRYIRQLAMSIWQRAGFPDGQEVACFRAAMSKHRKAIVLSAKKKKLTMNNCIICRKELDESEKEYLNYHCLSCSQNKQINHHFFSKN